MTWSDFKALVVQELGTDGNRRGIETLRVRAMRDAVLDLQRFIRAYRQGHTTRFDEDDLTEVGYAHLATLPTGAKPKAYYIVSEVPKSNGDLPNPNIRRNRLDFVAWENRRERMIDRRWDRRAYLYAVAPFNRQVMVHPLINDETYLLVVWDGLKMDFADGDEVPFPEQAAAAVAAYVKWRILLEIDRRIDLAREQYDVARKTGIYPTLRLSLYREEQEPQMADGRDEEYTDSVPPPSSLVPQLGSIDLALGATTGTIVFPREFGATPIVNCWVVPPDDSQPIIDATPDGSTLATTGFTALLAGAIPADGYKLFWEAVAAADNPTGDDPKYGSVALDPGDVNAAISFVGTFSTAPIVSCWIVPPDSSAPVISADPDGSTLATTGFTALFAGAIPTTGYRLMWEASLAT